MDTEKFLKENKSYFTDSEVINALNFLLEKGFNVIKFMYARPLNLMMIAEELKSKVLRAIRW